MIQTKLPKRCCELTPAKGPLDCLHGKEHVSVETLRRCLSQLVDCEGSPKIAEEGGLEHWEDAQYVYLEAHVDNPDLPDLDITLHGHSIMVRIARRRTRRF